MQGQMDTMIARLSARLAASQAALTRFQDEGVRNALLIGGAGVFVLLGVSIFMAVDMARQLRTVRRSIVVISEGAYDTQLPHDGKGGEIGAIWDALEILKERAAEAEALSRQKLEDANRLRELVLD
jgi:methyl-accepting chemotaxis protein